MAIHISSRFEQLSVDFSRASTTPPRRALKRSGWPRLAMLCLAALSILATSAAQAARTEISILRFPTGDHGRTPAAALLSGSNGILYSTDNGGIDGNGQVFSLTPPSGGSTKWTEAILHRFQGGNDGSFPRGDLVSDAKGNLYGVTLGGGSQGGGTVFRLAPPEPGQSSWHETILYNFGDNNLSVGVGPIGGLTIGPGGVLFGTTWSGGLTNGPCAGGCGTVFELAAPIKGKGSWTATVLYRFQGGNDGSTPEASLLLGADGALYGTTVYGGGGPGSECGEGDILLGCGTVFKLTPPTQGGNVWTESVLYAFSGGSDGAMPYGKVIADGNGNLFGTTSAGYSCVQTFLECGNVFELVHPANGASNWTENVIYTFTNLNGPVSPRAGLTWGPKGVLYGTGLVGVFRLIPPAEGSTTWSEGDLLICRYHQQKRDGYDIEAGVIVDSKGNLFGTASAGGNDHAGLVFELPAK